MLRRLFDRTWRHALVDCRENATGIDPPRISLRRAKAGTFVSLLCLVWLALGSWALGQQVQHGWWWLPLRLGMALLTGYCLAQPILKPATRRLWYWQGWVDARHHTIKMARFAAQGRN